MTHKQSSAETGDLPAIPDDDKDFTPELARKIICKYQTIIGNLRRQLNGQPQRLPDTVREALELAEDVLSRAPFSTEIWPNGTHPNTGIEKIRAALALSRPQQRGDD